MESLSPNIFVTNMADTISFYKILGFETTMTVPETGTDFVWAMMVNGNVSNF
jgi:hypothetical protein